MKKVIIFVGTLKRGGAERVASLLARELRNRHRMDVKLLLLRTRIEYEIDDVPVLSLKSEEYRNPIIKLVSVIRKMRQIFREEKPDVVVGFMRDINILLFFSFFGKQIYRVAINPFRSPKKYDKYVTAILYRFPHVRAIVSPSVRLSSMLSKSMKLNGVRTIQNPVDISTIKSHLNGQSNPYGEEYILCAGRLNRQKRFDIAIRAYADSALRGKIKFIIIGEGSERENLEKLVIELGGESDILLPGVVDNPFLYMRWARFFVLSSESEGFPNVLIESLACGTPAIATDCETGPSEVIRNEWNGLLVPVNDITAMKEAMERLYHDRVLCNTLRSNAEKSVSQFSIESYGNKWIEVLNEVYN